MVIRLLVAALVVAALLVPGSAAASGRIELTARTSRIIVPGGLPGRSGDIEHVRWMLHDRYGRTIGSALLECRWFALFDRLCYGEFRMPKGRIAVIGSSATRDLGEFAVVGGTGSYHGAMGSLSFTRTGLGRLTVLISV